MQKVKNMKKKIKIILDHLQWFQHQNLFNIRHISFSLSYLIIQHFIQL